MKKISERTLEQLRVISPDELVTHGVIEPAPNHKGNFGFCCPLCGSGTGQNHNGRGDGAGTFDNQNRFYCHACNNADNHGHKLSPIDLFAIARNLQNQPFNEICRQMCREFNIAADFDEMDDLPRRKRRRNSFKAKIEPPIDTAELELIRQDLSASDEPLIDFVNTGCGGAWRGLPIEILQKHGCKYNPQWTSPTSRLESKFSTPTPRLLIPAGDSCYLARLTVPLEKFDEPAQKYIHEKQHAGRKQLFNADALNADVTFFAVEGYIDCMSIELAGFNCVALGGRGSGNLLVDAVANMPTKPKVIILLDSDEQGRSAAPKLYDELINVGCPCVVRFLTDEVSKIDANAILTTSGVDALGERLQEIYDGALAELDAVATELMSRHEERLNDDDLNFLFQGDLSDLDFARRFERVFGDRVRWLTDEERWLTYSCGLWTRGSDSNSCVLPLTRSVADLMSQYAENKDERKLAAALKSTRKISSSITLLKAIDSIRITADDLNRHSELLNCLNGVIDLSTGKLFPHAPSLLITQKCAAEYDPKASSPLVENFFRDIQPDEMTRRGLLRWLGYCLTGETREDKFLEWFGRGANGKGVLSVTLLELLGGYGTGLAPRALLKRNRNADPDAATASLNGLEYARFALSEELPADAELDAALIKTLTGGDKINVRKLRCEYRTIRNYAKINLSGNYVPRVENVADDGILRRILVIPFVVKFGVDKPADPTLKQKLLLPEHLRGLLSLLVREACDWYREGLIISPLMKSATENALAQSNFVAEFIADNFVRVPTASVKAKEFIDELKLMYPRECARFTKRADLIRMVERVGGVTYGYDNTKTNVFKGIGKRVATEQDDFAGEPVEKRDIPF